MNERKLDQAAPRARYLTDSSGADRGGEPAFTLTKRELVEVVQEAVAIAIDVRPVLVDKSTLAKQLQCSPAHIDNLRKLGLPTVRVGEAPRFDTAAVVAWLRSRAENDQ